MKTVMLGLLAETSVHSGSGRGMGVVDLPVAREAATDFPVLVGSSLKGALRDKAETLEKEANTSTSPGDRFGKPDYAGDLLVSDGRLLLLPVRSLTTSFRWVTCPHLIERYRRDLKRAGLTPRPEIPFLKEKQTVLASDEGSLFLEERQFTVVGKPSHELVTAISHLVLHEETRWRLDSGVAVLHDDDFAWFVRYGLPIQARNYLDDKSKKSLNLWYEETLPPDTIMYALVAGRSDGAVDATKVLFADDDPYLQVGGNETVGQGWFAVNLRMAEAGGIT